MPFHDAPTNACTNTVAVTGSRERRCCVPRYATAEVFGKVFGNVFVWGVMQRHVSY